MRTKLWIIALLLPLISACASGGAAGTRESRDLITAAQIARTNAQSAYEAIEQLQPQWLTSRGVTSITDDTPTEASVFQEGMHVGRLEYLKTVNVIDIAELRYYPAGPASARFGMGHQRGVIEIVRKGTGR
jgi:hypothetical protein